MTIACLTTSATGHIAMPFPVGQTPSLQHESVVFDPPGKLQPESRLAHPDRSEDRHQSTTPSEDRRLEGRLKRRQLVVAANEGCIHPPESARCAWDDLEQSVCGDLPADALQGQGLKGFRAHRIAHQAVRVVADQDLAGSRCTLEASGDVHRVPCHEGPGGWVSGHDLTGVDTGSE